MSAVIENAALSKLQILGMISDEQYEAALSHPFPATSDSSDNPVAHLVWMIQHDIITCAEVEARAAGVTSMFGDEDAQERGAISRRTIDLLASLNVSSDEQAYDELVSYGLITDDERVASMQSPTPGGFPDLICALMWMRHNGALTDERWRCLRTQVQQGQLGTGAIERACIVEGAYESWDLFMAQRTVPTEVGKRRISSGRIAAVGAVFALSAGAYFLYQLTIGPPACDASGTITLVSDTLQEAMPDAGDGKRAAFTLTQVKEIGYAPALRSRGCTATVVVENKAIRYAFVVGPRADRYGTLGVAAADRSIVEARYGHVAASGDFASQAEPIGRDALVRVLRQEVAARRLFHSAMASDASSPLAVMNKLRARAIPEIADVEPLGACRELMRGTHYACDLLIEHNDLSFAALGVRGQILQGEFTFVREPRTNQWRVSSDFGPEFEQARRDAKPATFSGDRKI